MAALPQNVLSPKEKPLFVFGLIYSSLIWLVVALTLVGLFYVGVIAVAILFAHALYLAYVKGNAVRVSEVQFPEIHASAKAAAEKLGLKQVPEIFVLQQGGLLNAFATKLLSRHYIVLLSELVDGCQDPKQLDFVIGHEMTHLAAGHLSWNAVLAPFRILPWFGPAYARACEYTCDRGGHFVSGDLEQSQRALVVLAAGGKLAQKANLDAFMNQRNEAGGFWMAIHELVSSHPFLCKRVAAVREFAQPGTVKPVGRNVFAWIFAPMLGASVGGPAGAVVAVMIVWIGLGAAIAIPMAIAASGKHGAASPFDSYLQTSKHGGTGTADPFADLDRQLRAAETQGAGGDLGAGADEENERQLADDGANADAAADLDVAPARYDRRDTAGSTANAGSKRTTRVASANGASTSSKRTSQVRPAKYQAQPAHRSSSTSSQRRSGSSLGVE